MTFDKFSLSRELAGLSLDSASTRENTDTTDTTDTTETETVSKDNIRTDSSNTDDTETDNTKNDMQEAYDEETGEINWDCPCLGEMVKEPCGEKFKEAFSCFVYSKQEIKGSDCVEQFREMQECFQAHPEIYGKELDSSTGPDTTGPETTGPDTTTDTTDTTTNETGDGKGDDRED